MPDFSSRSRRCRRGDGSLRLFAGFLAVAFVTELLIMKALPFMMSAETDGTVRAAVDAGLLTAVLAPVVWWIFIVPLQSLCDLRTRLLDRTVEAHEEERDRIARDLHDGLGQALTAMLLRLQVLEDTPDFADAREQARILRATCAATIEEVRRVVRDIRPPALTDVGLTAAVGRDLDAIGETAGIKTSLEVAIAGDETSAAGRLPAAVESHLYRIVQEAITNAIRHAAPSHLRVGIHADGRRVEATIRDDGRGFDPAAPGSGERPFGIVAMRERAAALGGTCSIESQPGLGTTVSVRVPLTRPASDAGQTGPAHDRSGRPPASLSGIGR